MQHMIPDIILNMSHTWESLIYLDKRFTLVRHVYIRMIITCDIAILNLHVVTLSPNKFQFNQIHGFAQDII